MRKWWDGVVAAAALAVLLVACALAWGQHVPDSERVAFRAVNDHSVLPFAAVWPLMQLGNVAVIFVAAAATALRQRWRATIGLLIAGVAAYGLAKVVKAVVERPRPAALLDGVHVRGPEVSDYGLVSGHAAVSVVLVAMLLPYVGSRARVVLGVLAVLVALSRVYVGAHLPLDVIGGAALSVAVAAVVHMALGRPAYRPPRSSAVSSA